MGVYIPSMKMPKSCWDCPLDTPVCNLWEELKDSADEEIIEKRHDNCPLVEVPVPHGRLADCDAVEECLKEVTDGETKDYAMMLLDWAVSKRTVIEREEKEDNK